MADTTEILAPTVKVFIKLQSTPPPPPVNNSIHNKALVRLDLIGFLMPQVSGIGNIEEILRVVLIPFLIAPYFLMPHFPLPFFEEITILETW